MALTASNNLVVASYELRLGIVKKRHEYEISEIISSPRRIHRAPSDLELCDLGDISVRRDIRRDSGPIGVGAVIYISILKARSDLIFPSLRHGVLTAGIA